MTSKKAKIFQKEDNISELTLALPSTDSIFSNEDLLTEILLRVPAKSLIKFKCVSEGWRRVINVISTSRFAYNHYAINRNRISAIYFQPYNLFKGPLKTISLRGHINHVTLPFLHEFKEIHYLYLKYSCNGLDLFSVGQIDYCVCNLTTKKYVVLPRIPTLLQFATQAACLAFDPAISPYYKVILFGEPTNAAPICPIYIYSSKYKSWKRVDINFPRHFRIYKIVFLDGAIHWLNESNDYFRFLIDEERLITTQMPKKHKILQSQNIRYLGECDGQLVLIQCQRRSLRFKVLEMKKGTFVWNVKYRVDLTSAMLEQPAKDYIMLGIVTESHGNDLVLMLATPTKLISYNLKRHIIDIVNPNFSMEEFRNINDSKFRPRFPLKESLLPVSVHTN